MTNTTAPEGYERITWPDVRKGDVLFHWNGDRVTVTETTHSSGVGSDELGYHDGIEIAGQLRFNAEELRDSGFRPHRKVEPLPTTPGAYHDKDGVVWELASSEPWSWSCGGDMKSTRYAAKHAPFTRLVPMPTEEQMYEAMAGPGDWISVVATTAAERVMALLAGEGDDE